jgi:hypothetical protein
VNGPQHYRKAEALAEASYTADAERATYLLARAQVHATLALAAATALGSIMHVPVTSPTATQWHAATEPLAVSS